MKFHEERGSVLILVAWVFAIIGIVAAFLLQRSEIEWAAVSNLERNIQARQLAEEILQEYLVLLREDDTDNDSMADAWFDNDGFSQYERDGYQVTVKIEDESSKPNLNLLNLEELQYLKIDGEQIEPLLDWIDLDDELRPAGAEIEFYQALTPAYKPRNGFLPAMREILAIKDGLDIYPEVAPHCTVFGKYNLNVLTDLQLENLLLSAGFEKSWVERMVNDVKFFRGENSAKEFTNFDELRQLGAVSLEKLDELRPLLTLRGIININFISEAGLKMILKKTGYDTDLSKSIVRRRREEPFSEITEIQHYFNNKENPLKVEKYFTTVSTIIRYQIWLSKGRHAYYLEAVQERVPDDDEWRLYPLSRCFLLNQEVPELPEPPVDVSEDEEVE
ncbi:MAG: general secretion pathway protein GspK [Bacteroidota bacterium]